MELPILTVTMYSLLETCIFLNLGKPQNFNMGQDRPRWGGGGGRHQLSHLYNLLRPWGTQSFNMFDSLTTFSDLKTICPLLKSSEQGI